MIKYQNFIIKYLELKLKKQRSIKNTEHLI